MCSTEEAQYCLWGVGVSWAQCWSVVQTLSVWVSMLLLPPLMQVSQHQRQQQTLCLLWPQQPMHNPLLSQMPAPLSVLCPLHLWTCGFPACLLWGGMRRDWRWFGKGGEWTSFGFCCCCCRLRGATAKDKSQRQSRQVCFKRERKCSVEGWKWGSLALLYRETVTWWTLYASSEGGWASGGEVVVGYATCQWGRCTPIGGLQNWGARFGCGWIGKIMKENLVDLRMRTIPDVKFRSIFIPYFRILSMVKVKW